MPVPGTRVRPTPIRRRLMVIVGGTMFLAAIWVAARSGWFVEYGYARGMGFQISRALSRVTGSVSISLAELVLIGVALYLFLPFVSAFVAVARRQRPFVATIVSGILRAAALAILALSLFYLTWGLNYARTPLPSRLGWTPLEQPHDDAEDARLTGEIATIAEELVVATNDAYLDMTGAQDLGRPSTRSPAADLDVALEGGFTRVQTRLNLEPQVAAPRGRAKPLASSELLNHLGLAGFYFPWTGEANYNRSVPASTLPHTIAHEKAHQRGIASEDEASFAGYLACIMSDDAQSRYSGYLFAQRQLLSELAGRDMTRARALVAQRYKGVQRDVDDIRAFWQRYAGAPARVSERINNTYLKSQGVRGGVQSYAASRSLIVMFARHNNGKAGVDGR